MTRRLMFFWGWVTCCLPSFTFAQSKLYAANDSTVVVQAGPQYATTKTHQWLWGQHYRREWSTPVRIKTVLLDTLFGGLTPILKGGGRQTKTLRLQDAHKKEYVLRSIDKTFGGALPEMLQGSFVEPIVNDQVSIAHPFASLTVPPMIGAAGVYHTLPQIVFVPHQTGLDTFDAVFGNSLYLLEERPDGNQERSANFGNAANLIGTEKMLDKLAAKSSRQVDGTAYVRARLFDMFIGDWGRHEDQWRWAEFEEDSLTLYRPVPRDRDQLYTRFDGRLLQLLIAGASLKHFQSFGGTIKDIAHYNFPARHLDRRLAISLDKQQWLEIAQELQRSLTDSVIEAGVRKLPAEVFDFSGPRIIKHLKSRRDQLDRFALKYYRSLAREVTIAGSDQAEAFVIRALDKKRTEVSVYRLSKDGELERLPFYTRIFDAAETKAVRLFGRDGNDRFAMEGTSKNKIAVQVLGGKGTDVYKGGSIASSGSNVVVYDDLENLALTSGWKQKVVADSQVHAYRYDAFQYDKKGIAPLAGYNTEDLIFAGVKYRSEQQQWPKVPFGQQQTVFMQYAPIPGSVRIGYEGRFMQLVGKWNLNLHAYYDPVHVRNFFGVGNESTLRTEKAEFYRLRSQQVNTAFMLERQLGPHQFNFGLQHQSVSLWQDKDRFIRSAFVDPYSTFGWHHYGGVTAAYQIKKTDNPIIPSKGFVFGMAATHMHAFSGKGSFERYTARLGFVIPLMPSVTWASKTGGATMGGDPAFFQLNSLGGADNVRGFRRHRFYGTSSVYNSNELQYLFDVKGYVYRGGIGLIALFDQGRVWQPGEQSNAWHTGAGGGLRLVPFKKMCITATYAVSKEDKVFNLRLGSFLD